MDPSVCIIGFVEFAEFINVVISTKYMFPRQTQSTV